MEFHILNLATAPSSFGEMVLDDKPAREEPEHCPDCGVRLAPLRRLPPHRYRIEHGEPGDLLTDGMVFALSERVVHRIVDDSIHGLTFSRDPVELAKHNAGSYFLAEPKCTRTLLDEPACGIVIDDMRGCDRCRVMAMTKIDRVVLQEDTWDGSDIFMPGSLFSIVLVTQRFVDFVDSNGFTNFSFIHQLQYSEDYTIP